MIKRLPKLSFFVGILYFLSSWVSPFSMAEEPDRFEVEFRMLELINEARRDPFKVAQDLGLAMEGNPSDFNELVDLQPLFFNGSLQKSARSHSADMLKNNFIGRVGSAGQTPLERVRQAGFFAGSAEEVGETIGVLSFYNFIPPMEAVETVFKNLLRNELDINQTEPRILLSPDFEEIGVGFEGGPIVLGGRQTNAFLFTIDVGLQLVSAREEEFLLLINQARQEPQKAFNKISYPFDNSRDLNAIGQKILLPIRFDFPLVKSANDHGNDMLDNGYLSPCSLDGRCGEARSLDFGVQSPICCTIVGSQLFPSLDFSELSESSQSIYDRMLRKESLKDQQGCSLFFSEDVQKLGVFIDTVMRFGGSDLPYLYQIHSLDLGKLGEDTDSTEALGVVYQDNNGNGLFDANEGLPFCRMEFYDETGAMAGKTLTRRTGNFSRPLKKGNYTTKVTCINNNPKTMPLSITEEKRWKAFPY